MLSWPSRPGECRRYVSSWVDVEQSVGNAKGAEGALPQGVRKPTLKIRKVCLPLAQLAIAQEQPEPGRFSVIQAEIRKIARAPRSAPGVGVHSANGCGGSM